MLAMCATKEAANGGQLADTEAKAATPPISGAETPNRSMEAVQSPAALPLAPAENTACCTNASALDVVETSTRRTITQPSRYREEPPDAPPASEPDDTQAVADAAPPQASVASAGADQARLNSVRRRKWKGGIMDLEDMKLKFPSLHALLPPPDQLATFNVTSVFTTENFKVLLGIRRNLALRDLASV
jgi:hypothetical protein